MNIDTVPCKTCGHPTAMTGTRLCDPCWEVESRLATYLMRGKANAERFVCDQIAKLRMVSTDSEGGDK